MTVLQKTSVVLMGVVFCFGFIGAVEAVAPVCDCTVSVRSENGMGHCTRTYTEYPFEKNIEFPANSRETIFDVFTRYTEIPEPEACHGSVIRDKVRRLREITRQYAKVCPGAALDTMRCYLDPVIDTLTPDFSNPVSTNSGGDTPLGGGRCVEFLNEIIRPCANLGEVLYETSDLFEGAFLVTDGTEQWGCNAINLAQPLGDDTLYMSCRARDGLNNVIEQATATVANIPAYEPIAWSFPTDKINALNKVRISGTGTAQVQLLIGRLIKYAVGFLGALALCLVIYSGLRFMLSQGDEGKQEESLKMMLWAGIGIVALLGSYSIVTFVLGILK